MSDGRLLHAVDPQLREAVEIGAPSAGPGALAEETPLAELRAAYASERAYWNRPVPEVARVEETALDGPAGRFTLRLYHPQPDAMLPALLYCHGGGWVVGSLDTHDRCMRKLALRSGRAVIGIDYHLAPEAKFPTQIEETVAACRALPALAADWALRPEGVVLGGDSAGAQMVLASALELRGEAAVSLGGLLLFYGAFGLRDSRSYRLFGSERYGLSQRDMRFYREALVRDEADLCDPRIDLVSADLSGLPPVYLAAAALDPLLDDSLVLTEQLAAGGAAPLLKVYRGMLHGFLHYSRSVALAEQALDEAGAWLAGLP